MIILPPTTRNVEQKVPLFCKGAKLQKGSESYLECHHVKLLARGGEDIIDNAVALCPNCHRKMHSLSLKSDIKKLFTKIEKRN